MPKPLHPGRHTRWVARLTASLSAMLIASATLATGCTDDEKPAAASSTSPTATASASSGTGGATATATSTADATAGSGPSAAATVDGPEGATGTAATAPPTTAPTSAGTATSTAQAAAPSATTAPAAPGTPTASPVTTSPPGGAAVTLAPTIEPAAPGSADELAGRVDEIFKPVTLFRARFEQTYLAKVAGVTKKSTGVLFVERPGKLSFRYDAPNKNRVVSDGLLIRVYEADNGQMFEQPVGRTEYPGALAFLMGHGLRGSFRFVFNEKAKFEGGRVLLGTPRTPNPSYEQALFYIDTTLLEKGDPGTVRRVLVIDAQRNRNRFDFLDSSRPATIPPGEFVFSPPPGTTILK